MVYQLPSMVSKLVRKISLRHVLSKWFVFRFWSSCHASFVCGSKKCCNFVSYVCIYIYTSRGFHKWGYPIAGWFIMENPSKNGWFACTPILGTHHLYIYICIYIYAHQCTHTHKRTDIKKWCIHYRYQYRVRFNTQGYPLVGSASNISDAGRFNIWRRGQWYPIAAKNGWDTSQQIWICLKIGYPIPSIAQSPFPDQK